MLKPILSERQEQLLKQERSLLSDLRVLLSGLEAAPDDQQALVDSIRQLDELFLLVIVGEFNAGKSAFINALLGQPLLDEGVTPTTTEINILRYGALIERGREDGQWVQRFPADILRDIVIVDTPGTNAIIREHEAITAQFVPRADLVLFVTSADRPFTESERAFLEQIKNWGKKIVFVINKIDILETAQQVEQVAAFVAASAQSLLNLTPEIFPVSAKLALRAKQGDAMLMSVSRFEPLERYIRHTLDETERIRLKLANPLGVALRLVEKYTAQVLEQQERLKVDTALIDDIERQTALYQTDMTRDFRYRLTEVASLLYAMENRGLAYFDETLRLARVFDLVRTDYIKRTFAEHVVADTPQQIERSINELIDWLVDQDLRQWQAVTAHLDRRRTEHADRVVGALGRFEYDRGRLLDSVGRAAQQVIDSYDHEAEAAQLAAAAQQAVAETGLVEIGAVGLGALLVSLLSTAALDFTGVLLAGTLAALGLLVIPSRRKEAKQQLHDKVAGLRQRLTDNLTAQFDKELTRSLRRLTEAIAPYTRFIRAERAQLEETHTQLTLSRDQLLALKIQIEAMR
ncbi:MAG TPA: dynamin family protein [Anaerolineae bacterium]|nr:dynamin family protein [Anaerolineae bacterium]